MNIIFKPLQPEHFPLLLKWLLAEHVHQWWDKDVSWDMTLIQEKYITYTKGYKIVNGVKKNINAYIVFLDEKEIGYIQFYNAHDFPREYESTLDELPKSLAALDVFIGEKSYLSKGYGALIIKRFLENYVDPNFEACFVDPDPKNVRAIKAYENSGFKHFKSTQNNKWMIRNRE